MKKTDRMSRFASLGLVAILLVLAIYSVCATIITLDVIERIQESGRMSDLYKQAHYSISAEDSLLHQYYLNPTLNAWAEYQAAAIQLRNILLTVQQEGDSGDRAFVKRVEPEQEQFQRLTLEMSAAITTHQMVRAKDIHDGAIDLVFDRLEAQASKAEQEDHNQTIQNMDRLIRSLHLIITSTTVVFVMSILLFAFFWRMLRSYQRKLNQATLDRFAQMEQVALTDVLTGLPNHRAIVNQIDVELLRCSSTQYNCVIIFVDVDHFKLINDTWGHAAGDTALHIVGQRLRAGVREEDYVGRYGGEEFAILLTNIEQREAVEMAERLRRSIAEHPCLWQREEAEQVVHIPLTASFGLAFYPFDGTTGKELIEMADIAMYNAKHYGRNQVCLANEENLMQLPVQESEQHYAEEKVIQVLAQTAAFHDQETHAHALRMQTLAEAVARVLKQPEEDIRLICLAAQLHDIGKIGIPDAILHKPGPLTTQEWAVMRTHPHISHQILTQAGGRFDLISHIVVAHHERWDGHGYPYGLAREEIPLGARILAVVDSYDAMTTSRPYREARLPADACEELQRCVNSQYDPQVVAAFLQVLQAMPVQEQPMSVVST